MMEDDESTGSATSGAVRSALHTLPWVLAWTERANEAHATGPYVFPADLTFVYGPRIWLSVSHELCGCTIGLPGGRGMFRCGRSEAIRLSGDCLAADRGISFLAMAFSGRDISPLVSSWSVVVG